MPNKIFTKFNFLVFIFCIACNSVFISCTEEYKKTVSDDKMADILFDIHTAEVLASVKDTNDRVMLTPQKDSIYLVNLYNSVLAHHNITYEDFINNYNYYIYYNAADLDTIYRNIQQKILDLQDITTKNQNENINIPDNEDSLNSVRKLRPELLNTQK